MGQTLELKAVDGVTLSAYRADPHGTPRGALVVAQEIFGVNGHVRSVCDGFAADGYVAIAPALFDRYQRGVDLSYTPDDVAKGIGWKTMAELDATMRDATAARAAVAGAGKVGIIGYCWGGYVAWMAASRLADFACAIPYYGGGMLEAVDERPRCPVLAHFGERDGNIPVARVRKWAEAHPEVQVCIHDADHGFNCDQRGSYDAAAAKLARSRTIEFLQQHVG